MLHAEPPATSTPAASPRHPRIKRVAFIALRSLGAAAALIALTVGTLMLLLRTDWGGERIRRQIVQRANAEIQGTIDIKRLSFGGDKVGVWGVALRDPDGGIVAEVAHAEVSFSLASILRKQLRVTAVMIDGPALSLVSDEDGSNLSRATAPRKRTPSKPAEPEKRRKGAKEGWVIRLDRLDLNQGNVRVAVATDDQPSSKLYVAELGLFATARYATGNGSLDVTLRVSGESQVMPVGPLRLAAQLGVRASVYRFDADGALLGGTIAAHGMVDGKQLDRSDALIAVAIPRQELADHDWGPVRVDVKAHPQTPPQLDVLVAIPGVELTAKDRGPNTLGLAGRLGVADLGLTGRALRALTAGDVAPMAGRGQVEFAVEKARGGATAGVDGSTSGSFEKLEFGDTVLTGVTFQGRAAHVSATAGTAGIELAIASVNAGTSRLRGIAFSANRQEQDLSATFAVAAPARVDVSMTGRLDDDQHGLRLTNLVLSFPGSRWATEGAAHLRFAENDLSVSRFRLASEGQVLAIDGGRRGQRIAAHLALVGLRLGQLPTVLIDPELRIDGQLDVDVNAEGQTNAPKVAARVDLRQARYRGFSKIDARVDATLHDELVESSLSVEAPFLTASADLKLPTDALAPGAPIALGVDVKQLDIGQILRGAHMPPIGSGRLNLKLRLDGSADDPRLDLAVQAFNLGAKKPAKASVAARSAELGQGRLHVTYADRSARAELDFASAHGGTLVVDANTRVDLSYPPVKRRLNPAKLPVRGKVVAKGLEVGWIATFSPGVESLGGQVSADVKLAGTVGDPQFIGDVRWKNGELVATMPPDKAARPSPAVPPQTARRPLPR
jgi:hypothetical protein